MSRSFLFSSAFSCAFLLSQTAGAVNVGICMSIMTSSLSSEKRIFSMDDGRTVSKSEICEELHQSTSGGGGFNWKFVGGDAEFSQTKAEKLCSSSSSEEELTEIRELFQREIGNQQLQAFESCLNAFEANPEFEIIDHEVTLLPGRGPEGIPLGQHGDYYKFSLEFVWDPDATPAGPQQTLHIAKNPDEHFVQCEITPSNPSGDVVPGWREAYFIQVNQSYVYECATVVRHSSPTLRFVIEGYPNGVSIDFDE